LKRTWLWIVFCRPAKEPRIPEKEPCKPAKELCLTAKEYNPWLWIEKDMALDCIQLTYIGLFCKRALHKSAKEPFINLQKSPS